MRWWICIGLVSACVGLAGAQKKEELAAARGMLAAQVVRLDNEIAQRMVNRPNMRSDQAGRLEMEIDWRLLTRWMQQQAASATGASELQIAAHIRADLLRQANIAVEDLIDQQQGRVSAAQADAIDKLHQLTFALEDAKEVRQLDVASRKIGSLFCIITGIDENSLPVLRPRPVARDRAPDRSPDRSPAEVGDAIGGLNVSVQLRQHLSALATAASAPLPPDATDKDRAAQQAASNALSAAVDLSRGLNSNVAIAQEARSGIEAQLSEAVALFLDPRTRAIGESRLSGMHQHRQIAARINRLGLSLEQMRRYAAIFTAAQQNPETGARLIGALERFLNDRRRFDNRGKSPNAMPMLQRSTEEFEKQVAAAITAFDAAAARGEVDLETPGSELHRLMNTLEMLDSMAATLEALAAFKPRPGGGLERRVVQAAVAAASSNAAQRTEGIKVLENIRQVAQVAQDLSKLNNSGIPRDVDARYAGGRSAMLETRWRTLIGEAASQIAGGGELDPKKLNQAQAVRGLYEALRRAGEVETALAAVPALSRWIDWRMNEQTLRLALQDWQQALSDAISNYLTDVGNFSDWHKIDKQYRGLTTMIIRAGRMKDQCEALPGGTRALAAGLITPLEKAPYATERLVGFALEVWETTSDREALEVALRSAQ